MRGGRAQLACAAALIALGGALFDQAFGQTPQLQASPSTAFLDIQGPTSVSGVGPVPLSVLSPGSYRWTVSGRGLVMARGRFTHQNGQLRFRPWAGPTAMLWPPGMVHLTQGEGRGWYYLSAAGLSGLMWGMGAEAASDAQDHLSSAEQELDRAMDAGAPGSEINDLQHEVTTAREEQRDEERIRNMWAGYFAIVWLGAGTEAWLMTPRATIQSRTAGEYLAIVPPASAASTALKSALVPGAGQRALGQDNRATLFSSVIGASLAGAILAQDAVLAARRDYYAAARQLADQPSELERRRLTAARDEAESDENVYTAVRWILVGVAVPVYVWNVVDALVSAQRVEPEPQRAQAMAWSVAPTPDGVQLSLRWGFH